MLILTPLTGLVTSPYFTWAQFLNRFGLRNIIQASNKDGNQASASGVSPVPTGQPNFFAVQDAFNYAVEEVNNRLIGGVLKVPLDFTPNKGVVPLKVGRWAMIIAYCDLLDMRFQDNVRPSHAYTKTEKNFMRVYDELAGYHGGQPGYQMPEAVQAADASGGTVSVNDVVKASGAVRYIDGAFSFSWT